MSSSPYGMVKSSSIGLNHTQVEEIYRTLEAYAHNPREATIPMPHGSTFEWLWTDARTEFCAWLKSNHMHYWISGNPGTGKSTLMKFILKHKALKECFASNINAKQTAVIHYFFCQLSGFSTKQEKIVDGLLHAVLLQLIKRFPQLVHAVDPIYRRDVQQHRLSSRLTSAWSVDNLKKALMGIAEQKAVQGNILLLIDGFDECQGDLAAHLGFMFSWIDAMGTGPLSVKLCLASRAHSDVKKFMHKSLELHQWTRADISKYICDNLCRTTRNSMSFITDGQNRLPDELIENVINKAQGVFIWAKLVVEDLIRRFEDGEKNTSLQERINKLPEGLEKLYGYIIDEIPDAELATAFHYFRLLLRAPGKTCNLTLLQFFMATRAPAEAIYCRFDHDSGNEQNAHLLQDLQTMKEHVRSTCKNLVQVRRRKLASTRWEPILQENVTFIHLTLREFLKKKQVDETIRNRIKSTGTLIPPTVDISLMASYLRLLKTQPCYLPHWATETKFLSDPAQTASGIQMITKDMVWESTQGLNFPLEEMDEIDEEEYQEKIHYRAPDNMIAKFFNYAGILEPFLDQPQTEYIDELDRVLREHASSSWASKFYYQRTRVHIPGLDVICLAVCWKLKLYLKSKLFSGSRLSEDSPNSRVPPLLFYAMNPPGWTLEPVDLGLLRLLVKAGEQFDTEFKLGSNEQTLWSRALHHYLSLGTQHPTKDWLHVLQLMLEHGGNPNQLVFIYDGEYTTALHLLVDQYELSPSNKRSEVISGFKLLFQHGSNQNIKNQDGVRAYDYARVSGKGVFDAMENAKSAGK